MEEARTTKALGDDIVAQGHADACIVLLPGWKASYCEGEPHPGGQYLKIAAEGETLPDHFCSRACEARKIAETAS